MRHPRLRTARTALIASALAALGAVAWAGGTAHYFDGSRRRTVTLQTDLVATFAPAARTGLPPHALGATAAAATTVVAGDSRVQIHRVAAAAPRATPADAGAAAAPAGSPVYREGNSPAGRLMALPGGVLVKFKPEWSRARIDAWLAQRALAVERALPIAGGGQWFAVATPSGAPALDTANALFESGDVLAATPNWWRQTRAR